MGNARHPSAGVVAVVVVVVATEGVNVGARDLHIGVGAYEVDFVGVHLLTDGVVEMAFGVLVGCLAEGNGEAVGFGEEGGIVHLCLEAEGVVPLAAVFDKICQIAGAESVAMVGERGQSGDEYEK